MANKTLLTAALLIGAGILLIPTLNNARFMGVGSIKNCKDGSDFTSSGSVRLADKNLRSLHASGSAHLTNVSVQTTAHISGSLHATGGTIKTLHSSGTTRLIDTQVNEKASTSGSLHASGGSFGQIAASGSTRLSNTFVKQASTFSGSLQATKTSLNTIETNRTSKVTLTDCTVASIKVNDNRSKGPSKDIDLFGGTVEGDITFERKDGKVILHKNAQIKGNVIGGTVEKR